MEPHGEWKHDFQSKAVFIKPTTNRLMCLKSLFETGKKKIIFLSTLHLDLLEIKIKIDRFQSQRVKQDKGWGQAELTGCPLLSSVEKHWAVDTPPCQIKKAFHVNILPQETDYK